MLAGLFAGAALGLILALPLMLWPALALRASDVLRRAGEGDQQGRVLLFGLLAVCGMVFGVFLGHR